MEHLESRKDFLKRCTYIVPSLLGIALIAGGCNSNKPEVKEDKSNISTDPCSDLSEIGEKDLEIRKKLNYVEVSTLKNKICDQCNLYIPPKSENACGGCMLFKGPVQPGGTCTYWTPKIDKPS
jgi:hypothetical protein